MAQVSTLSRSKKVSPAEWEVRVQLAALYRAFQHYGWTDGIYTHLSARVPGEEGVYLINPYGLMFDEITASNLIKVSYDGTVVAGDYPFNHAGHLIHTAMHKARPDINFALHSHTRAGMAVAAMKCGFRPLSQHAGVVYGEVAYHDYQDVTSAEEECDALARDIGDKHLMIMRNHGLLALGRTASEAFFLHYYLEMACKAQVDALAGGGEVIEIAPDALKPLCDYGRVLANEEPMGAMFWEAVLRLLDRKDPGFRD